MTLKQRLEKIRELVIENKRVVVSELSGMFGVTEETIRRDLEKLEAEGLVARTYGGAVLNQDLAREKIHFLKRAQTNMQEKQLIAEKAVDIIKTSASIGADSSSTVLEALKLIREEPGITILTNSVEALRELSLSSLSVVSTGGVLDKNSLSLQGAGAKNSICNYSLGIALISCKGLNLDGGVYDSNESEGELKQLLVERANKVILLVDDSKFGKTAFIRLADLSQIDTIITNQEPDDEWKALLKQNQVNLIY
ncbi:MAG: DeoR/GlpR family DNA-binding transcription regulator [Lachnospiraceae bacterium]